jgi:hypothetical protein
MSKIKYLFGLLLISVLVSGFMPLEAHAQSTIVGSEYKPEKNITEYFVFPYGEVSLPGKWEKWQYNSNARQQFFINNDSVLIAISFGTVSDYEFNRGGLLKGYDFIKAYYDWESEYFSSSGFECKIIEGDQSNSYIIWRLWGQKADTYFLIGERKGHVCNFSVNITDKWAEDEKVQFLKSIYLK